MMAVGTSTGILSTRVRSEVYPESLSHAECTAGGRDAGAAAGRAVREAGESEADGDGGAERGDAGPRGEAEQVGPAHEAVRVREGAGRGAAGGNGEGFSRSRAV